MVRRAFFLAWVMWMLWLTGLNQLDKNRNLVEKMGKKAKDRVAGRFSMEAMIDKLTCIYHALLSNG